jgi:hypothetical protein
MRGGPSHSTSRTRSLQPMPAEHFIPLRKAELADRLIATTDLTEADRAALTQLFLRMSATFHYQFHRRLESIKNLYAPFDPDLETAELAPNPQTLSKLHLHKLFDEFDELAERANFRALTLQDLNTALSQSSHWGLNLEIDMDAFERLEIYARGNIVGKRQRRRLRNWLRVEEVDVPVYQRLIVMFRLAAKKRIRRYVDVESVYLKLFKDIPQLDLDMLLPATSVRMTVVDRAKILLPTLSGLGIAIWKILQGALIAAFAGFYGILALVGLVGGTIGYGMRSFYGYLNTKNKYQLSLTESLYYQNLDNNAGVFFRLLDEAEEQENCEAMLAYFFLWHKGPDAGWTAEELDRAVEEFLPSIAGRTVDFEVSDALAKLERLKLVEITGDRFRAVPIAAAVTQFPEIPLPPVELVNDRRPRLEQR